MRRSSRRSGSSTSSSRSAQGDPDGVELRRRSPLPIYVDEDCHTLADVAACAEIAHGVNIKLAKSGGIREAIRMAHAARALGLGVMLGCMVESGLGIAAGCAVAPLCDHVDLDGNLLLAHDPVPGPTFVDGVQVASDGGRSWLRVSGRCPRRGLLGRSRTTARRCAASSATDARTSSRSSTRTRAGETEDGVPIVGDVVVGARLRARASRSSASRRRAAASRRRGARCCATCIRERALARERPARDGRRRSRAPRARGPARRRAARPPPPAGRPRLPDRGEPRGRRADRPHRRLRLRDREDDRLARARPCGPRARDRLRSSCRRADGDRDRGLGHRRRRGRLRLPRGRRRALVVEGRRARRRAPLRRGPGLARAPGVLRASRSGSSTARSPHAARPLPPRRDDRDRGVTRATRCPSLPELVELHERPRSRDGAHGSWRSPSTRPGSTTTRPRRRSRRPRTRPACPPATRSATARTRCSTRCCAASGVIR